MCSSMFEAFSLNVNSQLKTHSQVTCIPATPQQTKRFELFNCLQLLAITQKDTIYLFYQCTSIQSSKHVANQ